MNLIEAILSGERAILAEYDMIKRREERGKLLYGMGGGMFGGPSDIEMSGKVGEKDTDKGKT